MRNKMVQNNETNEQTYVISRVYGCLNDETGLYADIFENGLVILETIVDDEFDCCELGERSLSQAEQGTLQRLLKLAFA